MFLQTRKPSLLISYLAPSPNMITHTFLAANPCLFSPPSQANLEEATAEAGPLELHLISLTANQVQHFTHWGGGAKLAGEEEQTNALHLHLNTRAVIHINSLL